MLTTQQLSLCYPQKTLFNALDLSIAPGQFWGVLGKNGSGKSSLLQLLADLIQPTCGEVTLNGQPLDVYSARQRAQHIGLLLQEEPVAFWGNTLEYVALGYYPHDSLWGKAAQAMQTALEQMTRLGIDALANQALTTLSGGERQRARLAQLAVQAPDYCLLDEPLQHLDLNQQVAVMRYLQEWVTSGKAVVAVLHDVLWASRYCDHILLLYGNGQIEYGPKQTMLTKEKLEAVYGCSLTVVGETFLPS